jgi:multidrug transporter EmrE-like cation transporter
MNIADLPAPVFLAATIVFQSAAHICLKSSAGASSVWEFFVLQSVGNLAGLAGVLTYTGLLKKLPLHLGFPLTQGLVALGVLLVGSFCIFRESFTGNQLLGCLLVLGGVILLGLRVTHLESSKAESP